jgi:hypothetical protein
MLKALLKRLISANLTRAIHIYTSGKYSPEQIVRKPPFNFLLSLLLILFYL